MHNFLDINQNPVIRSANDKVFWRISAYALIRSEDNKILMVLPTEGISKWVLPGGKIEAEEMLAEGIERECLEETGYKVKIDVTHPLYVGESNFYDLDHFTHSMNLIYPGTLTNQPKNESVILREEIVKAEWLPLDSITQENCHHIMYPAIEKIKKTPDPNHFL